MSESSLYERYLVLNQYRSGSSYKDKIGSLYHFPSRYRNALGDSPARFVYYEPRAGGDQVYFGAGTINDIYEDTEDVAHFYAEIANYHSFLRPVDYYAGATGESWEPAKTMRNSVRNISEAIYFGIVEAGGLTKDSVTAGGAFPDALQMELANYAGTGKRSDEVLRKIRRILEVYERPSQITNQVKKERGSTCQLCGKEGFLKRDGGRYCEVHHLFHLSENPPIGCLSPAYVVVLCPTCHRRMHYAEVSVPIAVEHGWRVRVDAEDIIFVTEMTMRSI